MLAGLAAPVVTLAQALPPPVATAAPAPSGYSQTGIAAEATAENAVLARENGRAAASRSAWARLAAEMGLPPATDSQIEQMIDSVIVEQERTTRTSYTGRLTVNFNPRRVQAFAGRGPSSPPDPTLAGTPAYVPAASYLEVTTQYSGMQEWLELRRRLLASASVSQVDVLTISVDRARLRLGLRVPAAQVAQDLVPAGLSLAPGGRPGDGWRVGLAGRR
ncbi:hypothetical protein [Humitalea rosea]|uniref:hypothetical protein n=1 Tax=Humitalea rosea TaxID=990373 RepID=UPI0013147B62|nr:hypothetical protein [Humitalea rosea]